MRSKSFWMASLDGSKLKIYSCVLISVLLQIPETCQKSKVLGIWDLGGGGALRVIFCVGICPTN